MSLLSVTFSNPKSALRCSSQHPMVGEGACQSRKGRDLKLFISNCLDCLGLSKHGQTKHYKIYSQESVCPCRQRGWMGCYSFLCTYPCKRDGSCSCCCQIRALSRGRLMVRNLPHWGNVRRKRDILAPSHVLQKSHHHICLVFQPHCKVSLSPSCCTRELLLLNTSVAAQLRLCNPQHPGGPHLPLAFLLPTVPWHLQLQLLSSSERPLQQNSASAASIRSPALLGHTMTHCQALGRRSQVPSQH